MEAVGGPPPAPPPAAEARGIGDEAEADLAAPLLDEGGEPVGEGGLQRPRWLNP
jgi:hypothetical protein